MKNVIFFLFQFLVTLTLNAAEQVRVLTWWDYLSPEVISSIEKEGFKVDLSFYTSNEVAFSRLLSKRNDYDVAVISSFVVEALEASEKAFAEFEQPNRRQLLKFLKNQNNSCAPYLWSASVFTVIGDEKVCSFEELMALKKKKYSIAVIDDPFEIFARILNDKGCAGKIAGKLDWKNSESCLNSLPEMSLLKRGDLKTSTGDFLKQEKTAAYGWHGEVKPILEKNLNVNMYLPKKRPVIGVDYVCILNQSKVKSGAIKFAQLLTEFNAVKINMKNTGYFSPYENQTDGLDAPFKTIYNEVLNLPDAEGPVLLTSPSSGIHKKLNQIIQKVRYEKN